MSKLRENIMFSLQGGGTNIKTVAICYQNQAELAKKIADLLPLPCVLIDISGRQLAAKDIPALGITHAIEIYRPGRAGYELAKQQRQILRSASCQILSLFDWQEFYLDDRFWGDVTYHDLSRRCQELKQCLETVHSFTITSKLGTDISFSTAGRRWVAADGRCRSDAIAQLPDGEVFTCPIEETFSGRLVVDGTITRCWRPLKPQVLEFKKGRLVKCSAEFEGYIAHHHPDIYNIGEFALGVNPAHTGRIGNISVDEKAAGTVHFALGDSYNLGKNKCTSHIDMVILHPIIETVPALDLPGLTLNRS